MVHCSESRLPSALSRDEQRRLLQESDLRRRELSEQVEVAMVWQLAVAETEQFFTPVFLAELNFGGAVDDDQVASFLRAVFNDRLYFRYKDRRIMVHSVEVVEQIKARLEKERLREALLAEGAQRLKTLFAPTPVSATVSVPTSTSAFASASPLAPFHPSSSLHSSTSVAALVAADSEIWPERERCLNILRDHYLLANDAGESELARELLRRAGLTRPHDVFHLLVRAGVWRPDENVHLKRAEIAVEFSPEELAVAEACRQPDPVALLAEGRRDLRQLPVMTIDGSSTRDLDDALHLERQGDNFLVGIHIADVAHYIKPDSVLFRAAISRVTSLYFPEGSVPMLPPRLAEDLCSLVVGKDRPAMSFLVSLTPGGDIIGSKIVTSVVKVQRRLDYDQVQELLTTDRDLRDLLALSHALRKRRLAAGALLLPIPDVNIKLDDAGNPVVNLEDVDLPARLLVSEMMVLANMVAAEYTAQQQAAGLFRTQDDPYQRLIQGYDCDILTLWRQRKQLKPGQLVTRAGRHSGVGAASYTTVTSPIRRLLDLVMQYQIQALRADKGALFNEFEMLDFVGAIKTTQGRVNQVRRDRQRYWLLRYLAPRVGSAVNALVVECNPRRITVVLTDCLLEADLPPGRGMDIQLGEVISIKIAKVDPLDGLLRLEW